MQLQCRIRIAMAHPRDRAVFEPYLVRYSLACLSRRIMRSHDVSSRFHAQRYYTTGSSRPQPTFPGFRLPG
jgi:hypothetical protein